MNQNIQVFAILGFLLDLITKVSIIVIAVCSVNILKELRKK